MQHEGRKITLAEKRYGFSMYLSFPALIAHSLVALRVVLQTCLTRAIRNWRLGGKLTASKIELRITDDP